MRVLQVDSATEWRGGQVQTLHLVRGLVDRGVDVQVACPTSGPLWSALAGICPRVALPPGRTLHGAALLRRQDVDLVAAQTSHAHTMALGCGRPLVVHRRVDFVPSGGWKYRRPTAFVAVSHAVRALLESAGARAVFVVPDGVTTPTAAAPASDSPTVLAVGALVPHKGHAVLAAAAERLPGVDIAVAGEGPLRFPQLRHLGHRDDVPALLAGAQVFVHPSIEEGQGQVVLEAMAAGVPVVATNAGGLPETVGAAGLVVPKGDPAALAAAIARALRGEHPPLALGRAQAARFSVDAMVDGTLRAYREALGVGR